MRSVASSSNVGFVGEKTRGLVHAFDLDSLKLIRSFEIQNGGKKTSVNSLALSADGARIFAGCSSPSRQVHCFDFNDGSELCKFPSHVDSVFAIALNQSSIFSGGGQNDKWLRAADLETQKSIFSYVHKGSVRGLDTCGENLLISGSLDNKVRLFDLRSQNCVNEIKLPATVHGVAFCKFDPNRFVCSTGRSDNSVYLGDFLHSAKPEDFSALSTHKNGVSSFVHCAYATVSADYDGSVYFNQKNVKKPLVSKTSFGEIHSLAAGDGSSHVQVFHAAPSGIGLHVFK